MNSNYPRLSFCISGHLCRWICCILCALFFTLPAAYALTVQLRTFPELVERADTIVVGTVTGLRGAWGADGQTIYTYATLTDLDVLKGDVPAATYELRMPGGVIGDSAQLYPGMPSLEQGERYILFIRGYLRDFFPLVGVYQGLYQVIRDENGDQYVLRAYQPLENVATENFVSGVTVELPTLEAFTTRIRDQLSSHPQEIESLP